MHVVDDISSGCGIYDQQVQLRIVALQHLQHLQRLSTIGLLALIGVVE